MWDSWDAEWTRRALCGSTGWAFLVWPAQPITLPAGLAVGETGDAAGRTVSDIPAFVCRRLEDGGGRSGQVGSDLVHAGGMADARDALPMAKVQKGAALAHVPGVLVAQLVWRLSCTADRLLVVVRSPAGPRVSLKSKGKGRRPKKSISSCAIFYGGCLLYSASRTQRVVALSSAESEIYSAASGVCDAVLVWRILCWMTDAPIAIHLYLDSAAARGIMARRGVGKIRHLSCRCLWLQTLVAKDLVVSPVAGTKNPAACRPWNKAAQSAQNAWTDVCHGHV